MSTAQVSSEVKLACVPQPRLAGLEDGGCRQRQAAASLRSLQNYASGRGAAEMTEFAETDRHVTFVSRLRLRLTGYVFYHPHSCLRSRAARHEDEQGAR
jgi:hypothetical protein